MAFKFSITLLLVIVVGSHVYRHETQATCRTDNGLELEERLKILNKPAIKSIKDETGALYDCVDINKQPAFDHPLLKDHKIQMEPTSFSNELLVNESSPKCKVSKIMLQDIDCPKGTVPIRRISKGDLLRAQSTDINEVAGQHVAVLKSTSEFGYKGARANINIINPNVSNDQSTYALIRIWNGLTAYTVIYAGWAVDPTLYGDHKPHFMIFWRDGLTGRGCFNLLCEGFVQVDNGYPVGGIIRNVSIYDHDPVEIQLDIKQDSSTHNWWLTIPNFGMNLGYWPGTLLANLTHGGNTVSFGGLAKGPAKGKSPPMAFGKFPSRDLGRSGYFAEMLVYNENNEITGLDGHWTEYTDHPKCYGVKYYGLEPNNGYVMEYGGPGSCQY